MKVAIFLILIFFLISCNNSQTPVVVSHLEDSIGSDADSLQNINPNQSKTLNDSKSLLNINKSIEGVYVGTNDEKYFKLSIDKVYGDNAEGNILTGTDKILVRGKVLKLATEPTSSGEAIIYRLVLSELNQKELNGEYVITLAVSAKSTTGEGNWISHNKRQSTSIKITERAI